MDLEQQPAAMMDLERPIPRESTLPSSGVPEETVTNRAIDEEVVSMDLEAAGLKSSAQGLTLDAMLERLLLIDPLKIGIPREESMAHNPGLESDEAWAKLTVDSHTPFTNSLTGIVDFTNTFPGSVLGQERDTNDDQPSAAANATFRRMETTVHGPDVSSIASDHPLVISSDLAEEEVGDSFGCGRPLACEALERQEEGEKGAIIPSGDVQSTLTDLAQQVIEKKSTPDLMPNVGGDKRPGDGTMLETTRSVELTSVGVENGSTSTSSPPVRSGRGRSSRSFSDEDKHGRLISTLSNLVDPAPSKTAKGRLGYAADGGCDSPGKRHKQPATKRNRVARSENNASLHVDFAAPVDGHEHAGFEGTSNDHPQNKQRVFASEYTRQKPDTNTKPQSTHRSQALELLQSFISQARAQCHSTKDRHGHEPQQSDRNEQDSRSLGSDGPRDEERTKRHVVLVRGIETPLEQIDGNISKSKQKRMKAKMRIANRPGGGTKDGTKQSASRTRANLCLAISSDCEGGPISTSGRGLVAGTGSDVDVRSIRCCTTTDTEINARDKSKAGRPYVDADGIGNKGAAKTPQVSSNFKAKERLPRKRQNHTEQVPTPINGSGDGRSKAISKDYEGSAGVRVRVQESESVLASRRENSHFLSPRPLGHQQLFSTFPDHHNPNIPHTGSKSHRSNKAPKTTTSAQASRRRRRACKTSTASGRQSGAGDTMSTSRGSIPGVRGQSHVRSSNQDDNDAPVPWPSRTPSIADNNPTRRLRGFQPAEVGKAKSNKNTGVTSLAPAKAGSAAISKPNSIADVDVASSASGTVTQSQRSATSKPQHGIGPLPKTNQAEVPVNSEMLTTALLAQTSQKQNEAIAELLAKARTTKIPPHHQDKARSPNASTISTPLVQTVTIDASRPELDTVHMCSNDEPISSGASSVQIITDDEPQQSCWLRAVTTDIAPPSISEWDNSVNPIDDPLWRRGSTLPTPAYKGPVPANFRNLPPYKLIGSKNTMATSTQKKVEGTWASGSFSRQMANIQQTLKPSQQPPSIPQLQTSTSTKTLEKGAPVTPLLERPNAHLTTPEGAAKVPPHLRAQGHSPIAGTRKVNHAGKGEADNRPPHLRQSISHSEANKEGDDIKAGKVTNAVIASYTPPSHLPGRQTEERLPVSHSPFLAMLSSHQEEAAPTPHIDIAEEDAAGQYAVDIENDVQLAAAIAAEDPYDDQQLAAGLQAGFDDEQVAAKRRQMEEIRSNDCVDTRPPHLRASHQKHEAPALDAKPQHQSQAAVQPVSIPQDIYTPASASHPGALKDVTNVRQNGKVNSPLEGMAPHNKTESAVKKSRKLTNGMDPGNGPSDLVGWDGKMVPALLGEDWELRAQHDRRGQEKLAGIRNWTEDHAVNPEAVVARVEDKLMSPITIRQPVTKPNPDEFNQAKRHLNTDDHIQAYKAKHSSSIDNTTPSSRGRMSKEEKRDARKRYAEEERNRVYPPNEHAPAANIYLRPAEFKDMRQVSFLHNHYVLKTACAHDLEETNELYWRQRLQETIDEGDPFLVAVHMGSKPINNIRDVHRKKSETIVGFAFAADYGLQTHAYRFTIELEMWVHRDHLHQGIGRSMLDRMLAALDPGYNLLECAPFLGDEMLSRWISGSHCLVKTILVNLLHNEDDKKDVEWKKSWLSDKNNFKYCGTLPGMGHKFGKDVDIAQMILRTSAALPPSPIS